MLGVSADDVASHESFARKFGVAFPLLADAGGTIASAYGVWNAEKGYPSRATFLIDRAGTVRSVWPAVKVDGHSAEVRAALASLG